MVKNLSFLPQLKIKSMTKSLRLVEGKAHRLEVSRIWFSSEMRENVQSVRVLREGCEHLRRTLMELMWFISLIEDWILRCSLAKWGMEIWSIRSRETIKFLEMESSCRRVKVICWRSFRFSVLLFSNIMLFIQIFKVTTPHSFKLLILLKFLFCSHLPSSQLLIITYSNWLNPPFFFCWCS